jgi:hypothetical protein
MEKSGFATLVFRISNEGGRLIIGGRRQVDESVSLLEYINRRTLFTLL